MTRFTGALTIIGSLIILALAATALDALAEGAPQAPSATPASGPVPPQAGAGSPQPAVPLPPPELDWFPKGLKDLKITIVDDDMIAASSKKEVELLDVMQAFAGQTNAKLTWVAVLPVGEGATEKPISRLLKKPEGRRIAVFYVPADWEKDNQALVVRGDLSGRVVFRLLKYGQKGWE